MNSRPPEELFLLIWEKPFLTLVTHDISDWGHKSEPPKYWIRYVLSEFGNVSTTETQHRPDHDPMDSETERDADGDSGPPDDKDDF